MRAATPMLTAAPMRARLSKPLTSPPRPRPNDRGANFVRPFTGRPITRPVRHRYHSDEPRDLQGQVLGPDDGRRALYYGSEPRWNPPEFSNHLDMLMFITNEPGRQPSDLPQWRPRHGEPRDGGPSEPRGIR